MSRKTFAANQTFNQPHWDGHGTSPIGWEGHDGGHDLDFIPSDDPDMIAAAMIAAREADRQKRERIVAYVNDIPDLVLRGLTNYVNYGVPVGDFLTAVLENDLSGAVAHADPESLAAIKPLVVLLFNEAPSRCWRHPDRVAAWLRMGTENRAELVGNCSTWQRFMEVTDADRLPAA